MTTLFPRIAAAVTAAVLLSTAALAGDIAVKAPWARASAGMAKAGAAFMEITSDGGADRLVAAAADVSDAVELHTHTMEGEVMRMRRVDAIDVPAGGAVKLEPGGFHIMFLGLHEPLKEGERFPLTLTFENAGDMTVEVEVRAAGAMGPMPGHGDMHEMRKPPQ